MQSRIIHGVGVSPGIAVGPARIIRWELPEVSRSLVAVDQTEREIERLRGALTAVRDLMERLRERTQERAGAAEAQIFDAQIMMLDDPEFRLDIERLVRENQLSAEAAFEFKTLEMKALWAQSANYLLRQRVADLSGIQVRVLNHLVGKSIEASLAAGDERPAVVFTRELTPGLTVQLEHERVAGFAAVEGARTAHAAILARSLGIPCVMGIVDGLERIRDGTEVILDGTHGVILLDPTPEELEDARQSEQARRELATELRKVVGQPAETADEVAVALRGNVDMPEEVDATVHFGAHGVGLLRTEFLVLGRTVLPTEDEQAIFFSQVARRFKGHPVVVRSYDLGGDKFPAAFQTPPEANPFLGWRAIRVCLDHPDMFKSQIRAMLRARLHGDVRLMVPMITQVEEVECTREYVAEGAAALERDAIPAAEDLPVGVMIETPAAVMLADQIAERSQFMSVGTNDLTQYTLAVDRGNARLAGRFTPHHPAVLQMLKRVVDAGRAAGIETSVCGEMGSDPISAFLLLGLGYRVLSVSPPALPLIRWLVRQVHVSGATRAAEGALDAATTDEVNAVLEEELGRYVDLELLHAGRLPGRNSAASLRGP